MGLGGIFCGQFFELALVVPIDRIGRDDGRKKQKRRHRVTRIHVVRVDDVDFAAERTPQERGVIQGSKRFRRKIDRREDDRRRGFAFRALGTGGGRRSHREGAASAVDEAFRNRARADCRR